MELFVLLKESLNSKGSVIPLADYKDPAKLGSLLSEAPESDWYTSLFYFPKEIKDLFDSTGSFAGYNGPALSKSLMWDFDSKQDLNLAKDDVRQLLNNLTEKTQLPAKELMKHINVYFSGNKGFHVELATNIEFNPEQMKKICSSLAAGLKTFDTVIYNSTRAFRIANTKHQKSGLYKIPINPLLLSSSSAIENIQKLAKGPVEAENTISPLAIENSQFVQPILAEVKKSKSVIVEEDLEEINGIRGLQTLDFRIAKHIPKCIYALSQGVMVPGTGHRNHIFLHLANYFRNQGFSKEQTAELLKVTAQRNKELYPDSEEFTSDEIKYSCIKRAFGDKEKINPLGWGIRPDDEIFASYCKAIPSEHKCPLHDAKHHKKKVVKIHDVSLDFTNFASNFDESVVKTGIKLVDENMKISIGTTTLIVGAAGSGKTTLCLNMLENASKEGQYSMFFSMDMHKNLLYLKLAQRHTDYTQDQIFTAFKNRNDKIMKEVHEAIKKNYDKVYFDFSGQMSIDDIIQRVKTTEEENNIKVKIVILDYASRLSGPHSDSNSNEKYNALKSKDAADETNAAWIILNQVSRMTGDGSTPIRTKRAAKGSGDWEESASNVITVWRPFMGVDGVRDPESGETFKDEVMKVFLAKNRMGREVEGALVWNGAKGHIFDMDEEDTLTYETELKPLEKSAQIHRRNVT